MFDLSAPCPCDSGNDYGLCCAPIHDRGAGLGTSAEQLMRARYSAYVLERSEFLLASWHPDHRPASMGQSDPSQRWLGLEILDTVGGGALDKAGEVEFTAKFSVRGEFFELHERSSFERLDGSWVYVDGYDPGEADS